MITPHSQISVLSREIQDQFTRWAEHLHTRVRFTRAHSVVHGAPHCERVLLYALILADKEMPGDREAMEILSHASAYHDSCRFNDYMDVGHGARGASYYRDFCHDHSEMVFHPESVFLMRYHDRNDSYGQEAIRKRFGPDADRVLKLFAIFKDADALDRWRLGDMGLDPKYLRTETAKGMIDYSRDLVVKTMPEDIRKKIDAEVRNAIAKHGHQG